MTAFLADIKSILEAAGCSSANPGCCAGTDLPGVGFEHAADCAVAPGAVTRFPACGAAGVPPSLLRLLNDDPPADLLWRESDRPDDAASREKREKLLGPLMFAARDLAGANIIRDFRDDDGHVFGAALSCRECHFGATSDGVLHHATSCSTGRVLGLIAELVAPPETQPGQKAAADQGGAQ